MKPKKLTLDQTHPHLLREWDYERNWKEFGLRPEDITFGIAKKVYWICSKYPIEDRWFMPINKRTGRGDGCPFCSGHKINNRNCLATIFPDLCKEWDYEKNLKELGLIPENITCNNDKKVFWICQKYPEDDKWLVSISERTRNDDRKSNCPYCSGHKINMRNCLFTTHPELCYEWDYERNLKELNLTPFDVGYGSSKMVWWMCNKFPEEDRWLSSPNRRSRTSCPYCSGNKVNKRTCLASTHPELLKEWDYERNLNELNLTPNDITFGSGKKVYWICSKFPEEDKWKASVNTRINDHNCPYCFGDDINNRNCLATTHPDLINEWNFTKNKNITPYNITYGSEKKIWWKCKEGHNFELSPNQRTNTETECPHCFFKNQTRVYKFLEQNKFNFEFNHPIQLFIKKNLSRIDFYLPDYNLFIEYDGEQHFRPVLYFGANTKEKAEEKFKNQQLRDQTLDKYCTDNNINILHIDGRIYQGQKLKQYLETDFLFYLFILGFHNV